MNTLQATDRFSYARACTALGGYDLRADLAGMPDPILAIAGAHDVVCPPSDVQFVAEHAPNARAATVDAVAHLAPAGGPKPTAELLIEFFSSILDVKNRMTDS